MIKSETVELPWGLSGLTFENVKPGTYPVNKEILKPGIEISVVVEEAEMRMIKFHLEACDKVKQTTVDDFIKQLICLENCGLFNKQLVYFKN